MNHKIFSFVALLTLAGSLRANTEVTPTFVPRSQGRDAVRKMVGVSEKVHQFGQDGYQMNFSALLGYSRSFREKDIAHCLFGNDLTCDDSRITIQGSDVANRCENAWFGDYFYLPPDYNAYFDIHPRIQNVIVDLDLYCGLNDIMEGLYFRAHGPITWTRWDLRFEEECDIMTTGSYIEGYFDSAHMFNPQLLGTFGDYARGRCPLNTNGTTQNGTGGSTPINVGVQFDCLQYAKIDGCEHSRTGFADLRLELGYDIFRDECLDFGMNVQLAAPTGNRTQAELAFDPTIGNRNHWEIGGGLYAHYNFYNSEGGDCKADIYFDLNLTHLNRAHEERTFDLCGRPNSRYMLAQKMGRPVQLLRAGATTAPTATTVPNAQFQYRFTPVANLTTVKIPVSVALQADMVLMLSSQYNNWTMDLGYNLWARTCERFGRPQELKQCCPSLCDGSINEWALKGDAHVFGFPSDDPSGLIQSDPIALSATQCGATIHGGTNAGVTDDDDCTGVNTLQNCGVDNAQVAFARGLTVSSGPGVFLVHTPMATPPATDHIKTSLQPLFINCCDINFQRTRGLSHKIFGNLSYNFDKDGYQPYLGVGVSAEFGSNSDCTVCDTTINCDQQCDTTSCDPGCCTDCLTCSLSQWSVWIKGGVSFDGLCG